MEIRPWAEVFAGVGKVVVGGRNCGVLYPGLALGCVPWVAWFGSRGASGTGAGRNKPPTNAPLWLRGGVLASLYRGPSGGRRRRRLRCHFVGAFLLGGRDLDDAGMVVSRVPDFPSAAVRRAEGRCRGVSGVGNARRWGFGGKAGLPRGRPSSARMAWA